MEDGIKWALTRETELPVSNMAVSVFDPNLTGIVKGGALPDFI